MTPAARRACAVLYRHGWHLTVIAALADCHHATVRRALHREGVDTNGRWG